jgi:hypothetical protein
VFLASTRPIPLTSATRNRLNHHLRHTDRSRAYELADGILRQA